MLNRVTPVHPYTPAIFHRYDLQRILIRQVNFPRKRHRGDFVDTAFSHLVEQEWMRAVQKTIHSCLGNPDLWNTLPESELLAFASELYQKPIDGARLIHHTNHITLSPVWELDVIVMNPKIKQKRNFEPYYGAEYEQRIRQEFD